MSLQPYSFCFLRYVHEPLSGEFANVGVLLWVPGSRFLGFKASQKFRRLSHFFHGFQQQDYRNLNGVIALGLTIFDCLNIPPQFRHGCRS